jgi:hypothetical protein
MVKATLKDSTNNDEADELFEEAVIFVNLRPAFNLISGGDLGYEQSGGGHWKGERGSFVEGREGYGHGGLWAFIHRDVPLSISLRIWIFAQGEICVVFGNTLSFGGSREWSALVIFGAFTLFTVGMISVVDLGFAAGLGGRVKGHGLILREKALFLRGSGKQPALVVRASVTVIAAGRQRTFNGY